MSGDFSVGAEGLMIRGALAEPVREVTVASSLQRMLQSVVAIGATCVGYPAWRRVRRWPSETCSSAATSSGRYPGYLCPGADWLRAGTASRLRWRPTRRAWTL